jgi:hypothetical protein
MGQRRKGGLGRRRRRRGRRGVTCPGRVRLPRAGVLFSRGGRRARCRPRT